MSYTTRVMQHHAELLVGTHEACLARIPEEYRTGPDAELIVAEKLTIAIARALAERAQGRPVVGERRHFIISCAEFLHEAQNALLKLFEDPPATAHFYIIASRATLLLPTLRSRLALTLVTNEVSESAETRAFLAASYRERLETVAMLHKAKASAAMRALIAEAEGVVTRDAQSGTAYLADVALASRYAEVRGGSPKMLLEHLALALPEHLGTR